MKLKFFILLLTGAFFFSCGKKDEPQTQKTDTVKTQQQTQKTDTVKTQQQTQTTDADKKKEEDLKKEADKKKEEDKKKEDEKKKKEEEKKKEETTTGTDFGPIFAKRCVKCHGADGKGKIEGVPDLTSSVIKKKSDKVLIASITNGIKAETEDGEDMPSFKSKLTEDEIKAAVKYVKGL